jgi:acyl transferase domain-containing protein/acyl carrier protein
MFQACLGNDKDSLTTKISYKLNLKGPSLAVQTFCSTSLVAVHLACQSLRNGESDVALAGGVALRLPTKTGYLYEPGDQDSPDGHTRTFDAQAKGTNFGDGAAMVVLKRLDEALADGDTIHAVIRGSAINNDGSLKVSYTAPSVERQAEVVVLALADAGLTADDISYVEAHGTATELGDPIEVSALTRAFRATTEAKNYCALGTVKTNIGHLDRASGVTGLIKTVESLKAGLIPGILHFESPNPKIDFANSPFFVNAKLRRWERNGKPRRAGVTSLGVGGTNAHVIVEEAPQQASSGPSRAWQLLLVSAKTSSALEKACAGLSAYLEEHADGNLADVAFTLQVGRRRFAHRRAILCQSGQEAKVALEGGESRQVLTYYEEPRSRSIAFMFPGVGDQYENMAAGLYGSEPEFRQAVDRCCDLLRPLLGLDLREVMFSPASGQNPEENGQETGINLRQMLAGSGNGNKQAAKISDLHQTYLAQPAVFVIEYALAQLLMSWGIVPQALIGYSVGEFAAATIAGTLSLEDGLRLVATRAQLIHKLPGGAMLAVPLDESELRDRLGEQLSIAVANGPRLTVVSGPSQAVEEFNGRLQAEGIATRILPTTHAFHSRMMEPAYAEFVRVLETVELKAPGIAYLSNLTGDWIKAEEATDPHYWARHMCQTVRFAAGVEKLLRIKDGILLEVGPGQSLSSLVKLHPSCDSVRGQFVLPVLRSQYDHQEDEVFLLTTMARLWLAGVEIDWNGFYAQQQRRRIPLPTYPFERQRYWIETDRQASKTAREKESDGKVRREPDIADWFYVPVWKQSKPVLGKRGGTAIEPGWRWLALVDGSPLCSRVVRELRVRGESVTVVSAGAEFGQTGVDAYTLDPSSRHDYDRLLDELSVEGALPNRVVHFWNLSPPSQQRSRAERAETLLDQGLFALLYLTQALEERDAEKVRILVIASGMLKVTGEEPLIPENATLTGPCRIIEQEYAQIGCRGIDVVLPPAGSAQEKDLAGKIILEIAQDSADSLVAYRGGQRWVQNFEPLQLEAVREQTKLRRGGVYLVTGGLGGIGLAIAKHLARTAEARLVLVGRSGLPPREQWEQLLQLPLEELLKSHRQEMAEKIWQILAMEEMGSEVLVLSADVADPVQMGNVIGQTRERFGELNGVFHAAGVLGQGLMQLRTPEAARSMLAPKVAGLVVLDEVLQDVALDFLLLISSMAAITGGGPGQLEYCAGNAYLDAYAQAETTLERPVISIDWGEWRWNAWEIGLEGFDPEVREMLRENRRQNGIAFEEGMDAMDRALEYGLPQVVVSTQNFQMHIDGSKNHTVANILEEAKKLRGTQSYYPRPVLGSQYVAPRNERERKLAEIWQELLGIEQVGIQDSFFELGGHSLLATQLFSRIRKEFNVSLSLRSIFEMPTIASQSEMIMALSWTEPAPAAVAGEALQTEAMVEGEL